MDQEQLNEFLENLERFNQTLSNTGQSGSALSSEMRKQIDQLRNHGSAISENTRTTKDQTAVAKDLNKAQQANVKSSEQFDKAMKSLSSAATQAGSALGSVAIAALNTERNFGKYGDALGGAGDAAVELGKNFGAVGTAAGYAIKGLTFLGQKSLEQADNVVSATDTLRKLGSAGAFTSEEFLDLAHQSGVTSKNLELLVKPAQGLGPALLGLGNAAGDGIKRFTELTRVTDDQRMQFRRLGIDQEELIESQAAYLQLQNATGRRMQENVRSTDQLQKASLEYTKNLSELSALTGKDIEIIQKEQQAAMAREEFMIQNAQTEREIAKLREQGRNEEADRLQKELDTRDRFVSEISTRIGDKTLDTAIMQMITSGGAVFSEETAALARSLGMAGEDFNRFLQGIEEGDEGIIDEFLETFKKAQDATVDQLGTAAILGGEEVRKAFLLSGETMTFAARRAGESEEEARARVQENINKAMQKGFDPTMDARATLTELEIDASVAMDKLLANINPLVSGFNATTVSAMAAAAALSGLAGSALFKGLRNMPGVGQAMSKAGSAVKGATTALRTPVSKAAALRIGGGAGVLAAGMGVYEAVGEGRDRQADINMRAESGQVSEREASAARRHNVATTSGQSVGVAAGALAGGAKGAAMGAALGPLGALAGGLIGAGIGAWFGEKGGKIVGGAIGNAIGEEITLEDVSGELKDLQNELTMAQMEGKSAEEITALQERIQLTERLQQTIEEGDHNTSQLLRSQLDLMEARESGDEDLIAQKEKIVELDSERYYQQARLNELKALEQRAEEDGASGEQLERARELVAEQERRLELSQKEVLAEKEISDLQQKIKDATELGASEEEINILQQQLDLRNNMVETINAEQKLQDDIFNQEQLIQDLKRQGRADEAKEAEQILNTLNEQLKVQREGSTEIERKLELEREIANLEKEKSEAGFFGKFFLNRDIEKRQKELEELTQPGSTGAQAGVPEAQSPGTAGSQAGAPEAQAPGTAGAPGSQASGTAGVPEAQAPGTAGAETSAPGEPTGARQGDIRMGVKRFEGNFSEARFAENDPEGHQAWNDFRKEEFNRLFEELKAEMPPGFRDNRSLVSKERDKARQLARDSAIIKFEEAIEAAGAGSIEILEAAKGGVFSGPKTGFPIELHGTELVAPLDPNSILMELAQTPASDSEGGTEPPDAEEASNTLERNADLTAEMMQMLSDKLDVMISALETGNEVSDQILKQSY